MKANGFNSLSNIKCVSVEYDSIGRVYVFDDGSRYHSVTTMTGATSNKEGILKWQRDVGFENAEKIRKKASHLGEHFHLLGEHFLKGKHTQPHVNPVSRHIFNSSTVPLLRKHVTEVVSVEEVLFSKKLKLAGRTDAILKWDGELSVFDFKLKNKSEKKHLGDYWIQTTIYAHCWEEMYGELPKKLVLLVANKNTMESVYYVANINPYIPRMHERLFQFNSYLENYHGVKKKR